MFIQVIRGKVTDAAAVRAELDRWERDVAPAIKGFLGSTGGVTDDGTLLEVVRFESAHTAEINGDQPKQREWWDEFSRLFDGDMTFYNCPTVDVGVADGLDDAGFVQVTICRVSDVAAARKLSAKFAEIAPVVRPDMLGFTDAYTADGTCITTSYFRSEAAAREGEKAEMPAEHQEVFAAFRALVSEFEYFDLATPRLFTPS